ncbi:hypothetical protein, partial [Streptomyces sp. N35]|uniref:hypothetical protein n=1 Tax=Streptomyces sp. N35 TaxID=2795730 RepID=UPI001F1652E9
MSDQNQQGSYDPYGQQQQQQPDPQWPTGTPGYEDAPHTQRWQGQTWETQAHPHTQAPAADTAYLPPQNYGAGPLPPEAPYPPQGTDPYAAQYGEQQPAYPADQASPYPADQGAPYPADQGAAYPYDERAADAYAYSAAPAEPAAQHQQTYTPAPAEPGPESGPAYGPATVVGNQRITDAQRARAEGRSPIIAPGIQPAGITAGIGLLLAGGAAIGPYALLVPLLVLQALTAAGWFRLNGMWPARQGIALAFAGALAADLVLLAVGREHAPAAIIGTLGVWVLLTLVLQLRSRADADDRMQGLMATVASAALAIIAAGFLGASSDAAPGGALAGAGAPLARGPPPRSRAPR